MVYENLFTRDITLPFLQNIVKAEKYELPQYLGNSSLFKSKVYLIGHGKNRYVEQYLSVDNLEKINQLLLRTNDLINLSDELLRVLEREAKYIFNNVDGLEKYDEQIDNNIINLWKSYVFFLLLANINDDGLYPEITELAKDIRVKYENLFSAINKFYINTVKNLYNNQFDARYVTIDELLSGTVDVKSYNRRKIEYWMVDLDVYTDINASEIENKYKIDIYEETIQNIKELNGIPASKGKVSGYAQVIMSLNDIDKMKNNKILVTSMTTPDFLPAMHKAIGFITDEGGILSHAAIVAREFKKPCIVGTKIATKVINDGDFIELDADKGVIRIFKD